MYPTRLDPYGCGCQHDCKYCYAKSLLDFRGLWNAENPSVANIGKIDRAISKLPPGQIVRLGGMTDCFQPIERQHRVTCETIKLLNQYNIGYLIVTKSHMVAEPDYLSLLNPELAHIQITVTTLDDEKSLEYEKASVPSKRIRAIQTLQDDGFDVAVRLSPLLEYMDFDRLNELELEKCVVEFLRVNTWIQRWFSGLDYSKYTYRQSNYRHLPLEDKQRLISKISISNLTVCEDVTEHYAYWKTHVNPNPDDCCNLRQ